MNTDHIRNSNRKSATGIATDYLANIEDLYLRAHFAQQVISNTLFKLTDLNILGSWQWLKYRNVECFVLGIRRSSGKAPSTKQNEYHARSEILAEGALTDEDYLILGAATPYHGIQRFYIPLSLLKNDPIAIAQWVRKTCRKEDLEYREYQVERLLSERRTAATRTDYFKTEEERETRLAEIDGKIAKLRKLPKTKRVKQAREARQPVNA